MSQSPERHRLYIRLQRETRKAHPDWTKDQVNREVRTRIDMKPPAPEGSQVNPKRFTGSQRQKPKGPKQKISFAYKQGKIRVYEQREDGSWKWIKDIRKDQEFNGIVLSWHSGAGKDPDSEPPEVHRFTKKGPKFMGDLPGWEKLSWKQKDVLERSFFVFIEPLEIPVVCKLCNTILFPSSGPIAHLRTFPVENSKESYSQDVIERHREAYEDWKKVTEEGLQ